MATKRESLAEYSQELCERVGNGNPRIMVYHEFLHIRDEASWEQQALFSDEQNIKLLESLLEKVGHHSRHNNEQVAIVASMGTTSTQVYSKGFTIGGFLTGTTAMADDSSLAATVLRQIVQEGLRLGLDEPIILVNSIGFMVKNSILLNGLTIDDAAHVVNDGDLRKAKASGDIIAEEKATKELSRSSNALTALIKEVNDLGLTKPCIIQNREKPKLKGSWMEVLSLKLGDQYPEGVYIVDFGGGGPELNFYVPSKPMQEIAKDRSLRLSQPKFVSEMMRGEYNTSEMFQSIVSFLRAKITEHAVLHNISPIVCKIFQTGMARQQHYFGHVNPLVDIIALPLAPSLIPIAPSSAPAPIPAPTPTTAPSSAPALIPAPTPTTAPTSAPAAVLPQPPTETKIATTKTDSKICCMS